MFHDKVKIVFVSYSPRNSLQLWLYSLTWDKKNLIGYNDSCSFFLIRLPTAKHFTWSCLQRLFRNQLVQNSMSQMLTRSLHQEHFVSMLLTFPPKGSSPNNQCCCCCPAPYSFQKQGIRSSFSLGNLIDQASWYLCTILKSFLGQTSTLNCTWKVTDNQCKIHSVDKIDKTNSKIKTETSLARMA